MVNDLRKAAILLMGLPYQQATQLLAKLDPKQAEAVSAEMARLSAIDRGEQEQVLREFSQAGTWKRTTAPASEPHADEPFGFLHDLDGERLWSFLRDETPQTIALVLTQIPPTQAASVLGQMPEEEQMAILRRIATLGPASPEILREVEQGLLLSLGGHQTSKASHAGGVAAVARIVGAVGPRAGRNLLAHLAQQDPGLADALLLYVSTGSGLGT
jgi:flagellar motor switch protein FliG